MKHLLQSFFIAFSMYSKIPMPRTDWTKDAMKYSMCFFPLVGGVIGLLIMAWYTLFYGKIGELFFTAVAVLIPVLVTGGIHLDGMLDTADALSSYKSREEKLEILKDSHAGAFAIIVGICYFVAYFGVYSEVTPETVPVLSLGFLLSRIYSALAVVSFPLAKNTGLVHTFSDMSLKKTVRIVMAVGLLVVTACLLFVDWVYGLGASVAAALTFLYYYRMSGKKFGGITGDLAGFFVQICELMMALVVVVISMIR